MLGYRNDKIDWIEMAKKIEVASGPGKFGGPSQLIPHVSNGRYKPLVVLCGATNQRTREHYRKSSDMQRRPTSQLTGPPNSKLIIFSSNRTK